MDYCQLQTIFAAGMQSGVVKIIFKIQYFGISKIV